MIKFESKLQARDYIQSFYDEIPDDAFTKGLYLRLMWILQRGGMYGTKKQQYMLVESIERLLQWHIFGDVDDSKHSYKQLFEEGL